MLLRRVVIGVLAAASLVGCGKAAVNTETHVGHEELYRTGNSNYDDFFEDIHALQVSAKNATEDEKVASGKLGQALGVHDASMDRMLEVLHAKVEEQAKSKSHVHFAFENVDGEGKPLAGRQIAVTPTAAKGRAVPRDAADFATAIEQSAQAEGQVWEKYAPAPDKARRLSEKADSLSGSVDAEFPANSKAKREEILRELKSAKSAADEIAGRCDKVVVTTTKFLKQGPEIVTAAAQEETKTPPKAGNAKAEKADKGDKKDASAKGAAPKKPASPTAQAKTPGAPKKAAAHKQSGADFNP